MEHKTTHKSSADLEQLTGDLAKLRDDFGELFSTALELGKGYPGELKDQIEAGVKQLKKMSKKVRAQGAEAVETFQDSVAERPLTSVLVSFGVGMICGALLLRK